MINLSHLTHDELLRHLDGEPLSAREQMLLTRLAEVVELLRLAEGEAAEYRGRINDYEQDAEESRGREYLANDELEDVYDLLREKLPTRIRGNTLSSGRIGSIDELRSVLDEIFPPDMPLSMEQFAGLVGLAREDACEKSIAYKATSIYGETCYFGVESTARAWAKSGAVEEVLLRDLRVISAPSTQNPQNCVEQSAQAVDAARYRALRDELISSGDDGPVSVSVNGMLTRIRKERGDDAYPTAQEFDAAIDTPITKAKGLNDER